MAISWHSYCERLNRCLKLIGEETDPDCLAGHVARARYYMARKDELALKGFNENDGRTRRGKGWNSL